MKRRFYILLTAAVLGLTARVIFCTLGRPLPSYQGQSINVWFQKLPLTHPDPRGFGQFDYCFRFGREYGSTNETRQALTAIQSIGTNGLPFIMSKFRRPESPMINLLEYKAQKLGLRIAIGRNAQLERDQAVSALLMLSPFPPRIVEDLKQLSNDKDQRISIAAKFLLKHKTGPRQVPESWPNFELEVSKSAHL